MTTRTDAPILETMSLSFMDFLRYPDLRIPEKQTTFITGESGTGKSTLLRLFNNSASSASGSIHYRGTDILAIDPVSLRRTVLLAGQVVFLFDDTIAGNFRQYFSYRDEPVPADEKVLECLSVCRAEFPLDAPCKNLSGGERQRVFLAIYLSMESDILMLDEPTSALDEKTGKAVMKNLSDYCREQGRTLMVVSHDPSLVDRFAENLVILTRGENA